MYLNNLTITGYKTFSEPFELTLSKGLNVLVGENAVGKSTVVNAIRLLLQEDEFGRKAIVDSDFHKSFRPEANRVDRFQIGATFASLTQEEQVAFLPWCDLNGTATLSLNVENKPN